MSILSIASRFAGFAFSSMPALVREIAVRWYHLNVFISLDFRSYLKMELLVLYRGSSNINNKIEKYLFAC